MDSETPKMSSEEAMKEPVPPQLPPASATEDSDGDSDNSSSSGDSSSSEDIDEMFKIDTLTPEEQAIVSARVKALQSNYKTFIDRQKEQRVLDIMEHTGASQREAEVALEFCAGNELEALNRWAGSTDFVQAVRDAVAAEADRPSLEASGLSAEGREALMERLKARRMKRAEKKSKKSGGSDRPARLLLDDALQLLLCGGVADAAASGPAKAAAPSVPTPTSPAPGLPVLSQLMMNTDNSEPVAPKKKAPARKRKPAPARVSEDEDEEDVWEDASLFAKTEAAPSDAALASLAAPEAPSGQWPADRVPKGKGKEILKRFTFPIHVIIGEKRKGKTGGGKPSMKLTKAQQATAEKMKELGLSEARIKAYLKKDENPNAYYYRFNDIGEQQATGNWTDDERALFLDLITSQAIDYEWGTFSMQIPGRVGYQCSNYYRSLILKGEIVDPNYVLTEDGKLEFLFKTKASKSGGSDGVSVTPRRTSSAAAGADSAPKSKRAKASRRRDRDEFEDPEPDTGDEMASLEYFESSVANLGPSVLKGFIDPITSREVVMPAMSPQGYVMGYYSWLRVLDKKPKNTCPFTRAHVTRRDLVKLTAENVEELRPKIVNDTSLHSAPTAAAEAT